MNEIDPARALEEVREAAKVLAPFVRRTPTIYSHTFSESSGTDVYLKLENLQRTGSYKVRGALLKSLSLDAESRARGIVAASAGNHAQGVALAAKLVGAQATIVMPERTAIVKVRRTESYGARIVLHGRNYGEAEARALELAAEHGLTLVHPFDDPTIVRGQGTVGLEILEDVADLDTIVVPIGGGGLISGIALVVKALAPNVRVVGVQAEGAAPMVRSFRAGERVVVESPTTIAEGIRVGAPGRYTFEVVRALVDDCVTVREDEIIDAVLQTMDKSSVVAEAAGVAGIAALIAGKVPGAARVCAVVSGGNIDLNLLARIIESGRAQAGLSHLLRLRCPDVPGQLARILEVLEEHGSNILDVQHYRAGWKVPVGYVDVEMLVETRREGDGERIDAALRARGFQFR
jgi:threonine dehydratase